MSGDRNIAMLLIFDNLFGSMVCYCRFNQTNNTPDCVSLNYFLILMNIQFDVYRDTAVEN